MASQHPKDSSSAKGKDIAQSSPPQSSSPELAAILQDDHQNEHDFLHWMDSLPVISDLPSPHPSSQHTQNLSGPSVEALVDEWFDTSGLNEIDPEDQLSIEFPVQVPFEPTETEVVPDSSHELLGLETISQHFYKPIAQAARELGIGLTKLKLRCRDLNIKQWPQRKLRSIQNLISNVQSLSQSSNGVIIPGSREVIDFLEDLRKRMEETPDLPLDPHIWKLRQSCYKAVHSRKRKWEEGASSTLVSVADQKSLPPDVILISDSESDDDSVNKGKRFKHISEFYP